MTKIEQALFQSGSAHCVITFELLAEAILVGICPWGCPESETHARFMLPQVVSIDDTYADGDCDLPWDIIGFDSVPLSEKLWRFCLHTDRIEYVFEAEWPDIERLMGGRS